MGMSFNGGGGRQRSLPLIVVIYTVIMIVTALIAFFGARLSDEGSMLIQVAYVLMGSVG